MMRKIHNKKEFLHQRLIEASQDASIRWDNVLQDCIKGSVNIDRIVVAIDLCNKWDKTLMAFESDLRQRELYIWEEG
jgi:hypothetical protein